METLAYQTYVSIPAESLIGKDDDKNPKLGNSDTRDGYSDAPG